MGSTPNFKYGFLLDSTAGKNKPERFSVMKITKWLTTFLILSIQLNHVFAWSSIKDKDIESKIEALLAKMTLEEKIGQMTQFSGVSDDKLALVREGRIGSFLNVRGAKATNQVQRVAVEESRLGIPLIFGNDVIHGYRTIFPIPLGEASTWHPELVRKAAAVAAHEASASGTHWTFAPMVDVARDPRWGRIAEGSGEDPYLGSVMARTRVIGFQGDDLADPTTIVACPKHYVARCRTGRKRLQYSGYFV